jgi:Transglycosylase SLT domain
MHGEVGHTQFLPKNILNYGIGGSLEIPANALSSTANFLKAHGWRAGAGYQPGEPNFCRPSSMECGYGLSAGHCGYRPTDRRRRGHLGGALRTAFPLTRFRTEGLPGYRPSVLANGRRLASARRRFWRGGLHRVRPSAPRRPAPGRTAVSKALAGAPVPARGRSREICCLLRCRFVG